MKGFIGGLLAAGGVAAGSGEAMAQPPAPRTEEREEREEHEEKESKNLAWAREMQAQFDLALAKNDPHATADVIRAFVREYHFPTKGKIVESNQHNSMRVLDKGEWRQLQDVAMHFMTNAASWGKEYPGVQRQLGDVMVSITTHIDEPGPARGRGTSWGSSQGKIDRSLGY